MTVSGLCLTALMVLDGDRVEQLYVSPEHQRQGHGSRLLTTAQATRDRLSLWTFAANKQARAFYEAHGFSVSGAPSSQNEEQTPAVLYRWSRA